MEVGEELEIDGEELEVGELVIDGEELEVREEVEKGGEEPELDVEELQE